MAFNEDSRVKIPAILHLMRLGYEYLSLKDSDVTWDADSNIFTDIFTQNLLNINPGSTADEINQLLTEVKLTLDNEDIGRAFFNLLTQNSGLKLIDLENFTKNSFHVVTELTYKNGDDEFRPDITLLVNGLPLAFIEVKKPHNKDGVQAEHERIEKRFKNKKFQRFINITQVMMFSNNMKYDDTSSLPIKGAFYAAPSYSKPSFNYFREEEILNLTSLLRTISEDEEESVLIDNNLGVIRQNPEFITNKQPDTPTNALCTSLFSKDRFRFLLTYAIAYVNEESGLQKHVMRYPQIFATKAIENHLSDGKRSGIIWHTQGSGKTALAYYNVRFLTDFYRKQGLIPKFYFIVDRLDLLIQASNEFTNRGLVVHVINSRKDFAKDIKANTAIHNNTGKPEITVVNIQKFDDDPTKVRIQDYDISIQRIYFLDEVHRSYSPEGSFLANLKESDQNAIKIGLTGTPLLGDDHNSRALFGDYIHKYYYNQSIADGYTLRLIREEIESNYKMTLQQALQQVQVELGSINKKEVYAHKKFVKPMLDYIVRDFEKSRGAHNDPSIGGMVICDSADQATALYSHFLKLPQTHDYIINEEQQKYPQKVAEQNEDYYEPINSENTVKTAALILHDAGDKEQRKTLVHKFKKGEIDILFVYNMLHTGFDAKRLKKLYLGRIIRKHGLLQALTRVNRTYKDFRYGYVVDFADIRKEFDKTNQAYFDELQAELGDEIEQYSKLFKSADEIHDEIEHIKDVLFRFDIDNPEIFSQQISEIEDRNAIRELKKALSDARNLYNIIRLQGEYHFLDHLDFQQLNRLYRETSNHLDLLNVTEKLEQGAESSNLLNVALEDVIFKFVKVGEEELILADQLKNTLRQTREALLNNFDKQDPQFISLREELERLFKKKNLSEVTQNEMLNNMSALERIQKRIKKLNRLNEQLRHKYQGDAKYVRVHKRLIEGAALSKSERKLFNALSGVKLDADEYILNNHLIVNNESYFSKKIGAKVMTRFEDEQHINLSVEAAEYLMNLIAAEYINEFNTGTSQW